MARSIHRFGGFLATVCTAAVLTVHGNVALADRPTARLLAETPRDAEYESLLTTPTAGGYVRFYWCGGHLRLDPPVYRKGTARMNNGSVREQLIVSVRNGLPSATYRLNQRVADGERSIVLNVVDCETMTLELAEPGGDRLMVSQPPTGAISVTRLSDGETSRCTGATWAHLYAAHWDDFPPVLWQLIDRLVPSRPTAAFFDEVHRRAVQHRMETGVRDEDVAGQVAGWMRQIDSPRRAERDAARRSLLAMGSPAATVLLAMDRSQWTAEQSAAAASICRRVQSDREDHAGALAMRLANDPTYWAAVK